MLWTSAPHRPCVRIHKTKIRCSSAISPGLKLDKLKWRKRDALLFRLGFCKRDLDRMRTYFAEQLSLTIFMFNTWVLGKPAPPASGPSAEWSTVVFDALEICEVFVESMASFDAKRDAPQRMLSSSVSPALSRRDTLLTQANILSQH
jgi:hypothetical protein